MDYRRSSFHVYRSVVAVLLFCVVVVWGIYWTRVDLIPFFMTRPWLNGAITLLGILGLLVSIRELIRILLQAKRMDALAGETSEEPLRRVALTDVEGMGRGLVRDRCLRILKVARVRGTNAAETASVLSDADVDAEEGRSAFVRYLIGVMVFLGLIGTFWGLLITVRGVKEVLDALGPARVEDTAGFIDQLKSSIGGLLGGMSTAFSTSLFGLGGSVILGFVEVLTSQARSRFLAELDRFVVSHILPGMPADAEESSAGGTQRAATDSQELRLHQVASQDALAENLRKLTDVIALQSSTDEKTAVTLVEIKGMLETLREEQAQTREGNQLANKMRQGLTEKMDNLARHMERTTQEIRLARESSDKAGKAVLDRMKLEGEITNKTLSMGFADLTRQLDLAAGAPDKPGSNHEETD